MSRDLNGEPDEEGAAQQSGTAPPMEKIVVAIHGVGKQLRNETVRAVTHRFGQRCSPPLPAQPLGFFEALAGENHPVRQLATAKNHWLATVGFAEVFWADIPGSVVKAGDTLEETKAWGRTVVNRAEAVYRCNVGDGKLSRADFQQGVGVVEEMVESVAVLENLLAVAERAGVFKFELGQVLRDYVDDVQLVADFGGHRRQILDLFHQSMNKIVASHKAKYGGHTPDIYIVAHSEGSVVSFLALLEALSGRPESLCPQNVKPEDSWVTCVRGYMTIGSPIDKHLVLWPELWKGLSLQSGLDGQRVVPSATPIGRPTLQQQIKWRNYYDHGDPVGFQLDSAAAFLKEHGCAAFEFDTAKHDIGYSRSALPGKAHIDYWADDEVFGHFIDDVMRSPADAKRPADKPVNKVICYALPYFLTFALHLAAVFLLLKAACLFDAKDSPFKQFMPMLGAVLAAGAALCCATAAARLPRLARRSDWRWRGGAACLWLVSVGAMLAMPKAVTDYLVNAVPPFGWQWAIAGVSALVLSGWGAPRKPRAGRRCLMAAGALFFAATIGAGLIYAQPEKIWPSVLAGLAAIYVWWIAIMLFDLTFIWHRYIRNAVIADSLNYWHNRSDAVPREYFGIGKRRPPAPTQPAPAPAG